MSTTELIDQLRRLDNTERLAVIEAASRLIRKDLSSAKASDERIRERAEALKDLYEPGGQLTEWTVLDGEEVIDDSSPG